MARSNADLLAMKSELTNDPEALGYVAPPAIDDVGNANLVNEVRSTISIMKRSLSTAELFNAIKPLEHQALTPQQARWLDSVLSLQQIDPFGNDQIVLGLREMFPTGVSESRAAIESTLVQSGSRVQEMYQQGLLESPNNWTPSEIANARQAT